MTPPADGLAYLHPRVNVSCHQQLTSNLFRRCRLKRSSDLSSPVVGLHSVGRCISGRFCRVYLGTGKFLRPQGASLQAFTPFWGLGLLPDAWGAQKRECRRSQRYFWLCRTRVGFCPATRPTLKRPCATFVRWWDVWWIIRRWRLCVINTPVWLRTRPITADSTIRLLVWIFFFKY